MIRVMLDSKILISGMFKLYLYGYLNRITLATWKDKAA